MSKSLSLFDSYLRKEVTIDPNKTLKPGILKLYSCGPTVYNYQSIGNMRAVWLPDTIASLTKMLGMEVEWVTNITDVGHLVGDGDDGEDKLETGARRENKQVSEIVDFYTQDFEKQCKALNFDLPVGKFNPKASDYIGEQMLLALELLAEDKAYLTTDGIYLDFLKVQNDLSKDDLRASKQLQEILKTQDKQVGSNRDYTGREIVDGGKKHPSDFALWKFVSDKALQKWKFNQFDETEDLMIEILKRLDESDWDLPNRWGTPGWHSECVCMICQTIGSQRFKSIKDLQATETDYEIDIHTGGEDHIDIHHKNEILQSEALGFKLSKYWVHNKFVMVDGGKMSKSLGNVYLVIGDESVTGFKSISEEGFDPLAYRLMMMEHHYTQQLNFTWDKLKQSQARLYSIRKDVAQIRSFWLSQGSLDLVLESKQIDFYLDILCDNLNTPLFLEKFSKLVQETLNFILQEKRLNVKNLAAIEYLEKNFLKLDLLPQIPPDILTLAKKRLQAKIAKDYQLADQLRDQVTDQNYKIEDYSWGFGVWKVR
jgi:cysteinyl-tRNA synthetase